ncbi:unnamed protein product [Cochlearia groenlandica]
MGQRFTAMENRVGNLEGNATKGKNVATVNTTDVESQAKRDDYGSKEKDPVFVDLRGACNVRGTFATIPRFEEG